MINDVSVLNNHISLCVVVLREALPALLLQVRLPKRRIRVIPETQLPKYANAVSAEHPTPLAIAEMFPTRAQCGTDCRFARRAICNN